MQLWGGGVGPKFDAESLRPTLRRMAQAARAHFAADSVEIVLHDGDDAFRCGEDGVLQLVVDAGPEVLFAEPLWSVSKRRNAELGLGGAALAASAPVRFTAEGLRGRLTVFAAARAYDETLAEILADLADGVATTAERLYAASNQDQARAEADAAEQLLLNMMAAAPVAMVVTDRDLRLMHASPRWSQELGLVGQEIVGQSMAELLPDVAARWGGRIQACLDGETLKADRIRFATADGRHIWARVEVTPWQDPQGKIGGLLFLSQVGYVLRQEQDRRPLVPVSGHIRPGGSPGSGAALRRAHAPGHGALGDPRL